MPGLLLGDRCNSKWYWHSFYALWSPFGLHQQAPWPQNTRHISRWKGTRGNHLHNFIHHRTMALLLATFRVYLQPDHKRLIDTSTSSSFTPIWQQKVFTKIIGLPYRNAYKKGCRNRVVDALSHRPHDQLQCSIAWLFHLTIRSDAPRSYEKLHKDSMDCYLLSKLVISPLVVLCYTYTFDRWITLLQEQDLAFTQKKKNKIWLVNNTTVSSQGNSCPSLPLDVFAPGCPRLKKLFLWKSMKKMMCLFTWNYQLGLSTMINYFLS